MVEHDVTAIKLRVQVSYTFLLQYKIYIIFIRKELLINNIFPQELIEVYEIYTIYE